MNNVFERSCTITGLFRNVPINGNNVILRCWVVIKPDEIRRTYRGQIGFTELSHAAPGTRPRMAFSGKPLK
jgi:hypothetical protein